MILNSGRHLYEEEENILFYQSTDILVSVVFFLIVFILVFQIYI